MLNACYNTFWGKVFMKIDNNIILNRQNPTLPKPPARDPLDIYPPMVCRAVFEEICILANGDIVCSCADGTGNRIYGNIYRDRIEQVFNNPMYREIRNWQLYSKPQSYCPVINRDCGLRTFRADNEYNEVRHTIKRLQLEPTSYCNLKCLDCLIGLCKNDLAFRKKRDAFLSLDVMKDIVDQLQGLEIMFFYNFGESFLHPDALPFLRYFRSRNPGTVVIVNTNGIPLDNTIINAIASETLVNHFSFSIDGLWQSSYGTYRKHGDIKKALANLKAMAKAIELYGTKNKVNLIWQYILFEWNDSDKEIDEAKQLAKEIGCKMLWILTHTKGASRKFTTDSHEYQQLVSSDDSMKNLSSDLQLENFLENEGSKDGISLASLIPESYTLTALKGASVRFPLTIQNLALIPWKKNVANAFRLGIRLLSKDGTFIRELAPAFLPDEVLMPKGKISILIETTAPIEEGTYKLMVDIVEEYVCWFSDKGSPPAIITLHVT